MTKARFGDSYATGLRAITNDGEAQLTLQKYSLAINLLEAGVFWIAIFLLSHRLSPGLARLTACCFDTIVLVTAGLAYLILLAANRFSAGIEAGIMTADWIAADVCSIIFLRAPVVVLLGNVDALRFAKKVKVVVLLFTLAVYTLIFYKVRFVSQEWLALNMTTS
jgi:hypothetical protein